MDHDRQQPSIDRAITQLTALIGATPDVLDQPKGVRIEADIPDDLSHRWEELLGILDLGTTYGLTRTAAGRKVWLTFAAGQEPPSEPRPDDRAALQPFAKGHGAGNDFLILPDPYGDLVLTPAGVERLCDRRTGIGADGVLRAVLCTATPEAAAMAAEAEWFMDYRNADGSLGQMCGNGIRVLARYLIDTGHCPPGDLTIATRSGPRTVQVPSRSVDFDGPVTVAMGRPALPGPTDVTVTTGAGTWRALHVDMGNPHAVAFVEDLSDPGDLASPPHVTPTGAYPRGLTVEFVVRRGPADLEVRVYERGVGETFACGTGACAAVAAVLNDGGPIGVYRVHMPGGQLRINALADGSMELTGPATIVANGTIQLHPDAFPSADGGRQPNTSP